MKSDKENKQERLIDNSVQHEKIEPGKEEVKNDDEDEQIVGFNLKQKKQKVPEFLGIFPLSVEAIKDYTFEAITEKTKKYPEDLSLQTILKNFKLEKQPFKFVDNPHIVALYIGKDKKILKTSSYREFPKNTQVEFKIIGHILVPNKLMIALCDYDSSVFNIENKYPHMILMDGEWTAKESSQILKAIFEENHKYKFQEFKLAGKLIDKMEIDLFGKQETIYIASTFPSVGVLSETDSK